MVALTVPPRKFQSVSGLWDRRNDGSPMRTRAPCPFQSVSGLWDRRNVRTRSGGRRPRRFNPSPVCGTGEMISMWGPGVAKRVSIRLRSVGPEKW